MPKKFAIPDTDVPTGYTNYPSFHRAWDASSIRERLHPGGPFGKMGLRFIDISTVTSETILFAEGAKPVPWTKPEDLVIAPDRPLPALGGIFEGGFLVAMVG